MSIDVMKQALEALDCIYSPMHVREIKKVGAAMKALRAAIENEEIHTSVSSNTHQPEQERVDAHLFYAPGDVLICKESDEKVTVVNGNTGPLQLANGNITLEWEGDDGVFGEYTLQQIMDGFIREMRVEPEQEPVAWMVYTLDGKSVCVTDNPADFSEQHKALPLYTHPPAQEPVAYIGTDGELGWLKKPTTVRSVATPLYMSTGENK